jgi:hypothetical protein
MALDEMTLPLQGVWGADQRCRAEAARSAAVERDRIGAIGRRVLLGAGWNLLTIIPPHFRVRAFHSAPGTQVSSRDRDFRPTRRRGFDDDNFEAPRRSFGSTPQFGGQRFDAPSGPPVQAVVKWYNPDKGFGFIELAMGPAMPFCM